MYNKQYEQVIDIIFNGKYNANEIVLNLAKKHPAIFLELVGTVVNNTGVSDDAIDTLCHLIRFDSAVACIKQIRTMGDFGLKEAKDVYDVVVGRVEIGDVRIGNLQQKYIDTVSATYFHRYGEKPVYTPPKW